MITCSFCGKNENQVWRLVAGPGVYICGDCLEVSMQILNASGPNTASLRVVSRQPDGTVQRSDHGPVGDMNPKNRWLRQCSGCGAWNVGAGVTACLDCGTDLLNRR
ncbi:MAG TPA: ClpX C4-type zinc finger protein [Symbiobacteriaceae bacterium]|nr:ClpX C4-type zinc finger protein [Symbiobacteriaceae bacterium]